jgi:hypothetical protein
MAEQTELRIIWDPNKEPQNARKHGLDFSFAAPIFADPLAITALDRIVDGEARWHTIGAVSAGLTFKVLLVVHTCAVSGDETWVRVN